MVAVGLPVMAAGDKNNSLGPFASAIHFANDVGKTAPLLPDCRSFLVCTHPSVGTSAKSPTLGLGPNGGVSCTTQQVAGYKLF